MIVHDVLQGSPEWHALRLGTLTASRVDQLLTAAKLNLSTGRLALLAKLQHEWVTGTSAEQFGGNAWTEHGHEYEGAAGDWFASVTGEAVQAVGFISDESGLAGCSPDLWVPGEAGVELKCPAGWTHLKYLRDGVVPSEYRMQVQFSLWVTGLPVWYFMSYGASPSGNSFLPAWKPGAYMPPMMVECEPEERYQDAFDAHVPAFLDEVQAERQWLLDNGVKVAE